MTLNISVEPSKHQLVDLVGRYRSDVLASLVVFLVALPLCIGIAVASGVTPEAAIITAIVGGLVTGMMPGSSLQVSGPAAGLAVLVFDAVQTHGTATLGMIVLGSGVLQILMGLARLGKWFQAMASSVVAGMLAGIGLLIILGQAYALADRKAPGDAVHNLIGLPALLQGASGDPAARGALLLGVCGLVVIAFWGRAPKALRVVPGPLAAVLVVAALAAFLHADVRMLSVGVLLDAVHLPTAESAGALMSPAVLGTMLVFALIGSAESLFGATAVDRMHNGPKTRYNKELLAQGTGNVVSGFLGGIPLTAVVVRSAANVHAGARTKLSRVLHGVWMLAFAVLAPGVLRLVPITVLAAILVFSGWKLLNPRQVPQLWRHDRGEAAVLIVTTCAILATDLLEGVVIGLVAALFKLAWQMSRLTATRGLASGGGVELVFGGSATFLTVPKLQAALDAVRDDVVHLDMTSLTHLDRTCHGVVDDWARQRGKEGAKVTTALPPGAHRNLRNDGVH
ncbi:MFS superfamily sulfate permease-like transporter [Saccharothrix ecbatanensis]|uniref:MFS superfamily sulfate permease-like transporter n=1 Tax=Saccharothrix ecbatanensis TaxID=1105145 RepID=A0A7W9HIT5_9PSEU|nr:SulP family inorganic anion transporter [Saccharothrix ecbatanensis]MBB5802980.1 MFS superfamily sulfate permease-like transporter [Saccharothrix ecbatanensis]